MPGGVVWHPLGLCAGDSHRPRIRFWEGMEENRIHSLFLSSSFKCEDGAVQRQMPPLRGAWAQTAWAASYRWSPASEDACWGRGFLIWKGEAMVLTPWDCAGDTPPVPRQESMSQQRQELGGAMGTRSQSKLCRRLPSGPLVAQDKRRESAVGASGEGEALAWGWVSVRLPVLFCKVYWHPRPGQGV